MLWIRRTCGDVVFLLVLLTLDTPMPAAEVSTQGLIGDLTNLFGMAEYPNPPYLTRQFSSYDRASTTADNAKTWFANGDCGNPKALKAYMFGLDYVLLKPAE